MPKPPQATLERRAQGQTRRAQRLLEETEAAVQRCHLGGKHRKAIGKS